MGLEEPVVDLDAQVGGPMFGGVVGLGGDEVEDVGVGPMLDGHAGRPADVARHDALGDGVVEVHGVE